MVKLTKIVIQGFKSFKRKVSIPILPGFSVFTGPNGSGKTNIADAIAFVLGKIPSKTLRASKVQDLIFHGSKKKTSSDFAYVTLYFDNSNKELPFNEKEITISRKINKKGVSTYRLNGKIVTRQHIIDTFSKINLHPNGYNIIQQGDVNQIVEMNAIERRKIIDDISGISEYDEKKEKAEKELTKIEGKIKEAEIILREKDQIVEKLRKEKETALEYQKLNNDLEKIRKTITWKQHSSAKSDIEEINKQLEQKERELKELKNEIDRYDKKLAEEEKKLEDLTADVIRTSDEMEIEKKITVLKSETERLEDKIESNKREIMRIEAMTESLKGMDVTPAVKAIIGFEGVHGTVADLIHIPAKYSTAVEVSAGKRLQNVVVDSSEIAVKCIKYLKTNKIGRAKFLPLDRLRAPIKKQLPPGSIGWLSDLITYDDKYSIVVEYMFGNVLCVENIDKAKKIFKDQRVKIVTLDGDLIEVSGAMIGGFLKRRKNVSNEIKRYLEEKQSLEREITTFEKRMKEIGEEIKLLSSKLSRKQKPNILIKKSKIDISLRKLREKRREKYEKMLSIQQEIGTLNIKKAKLEAKIDNLAIQIAGVKENELRPFNIYKISELKKKEKKILERMQMLGSVNLKALEDFENIKTEFEEFKEKFDKIVSERNSILETMKRINEKRIETFMHTFKKIRNHFQKIYAELTQGTATLELEEPSSIDSGLLIKANPGGKKLLNIDSMSCGEKTLTAFAFLFAIQKYKPAPFYILDEADASLDKKNSERVAKLIKTHSKDAQFIAISHNDLIIKEAHQIYGVSMQDGESKIFGIKLPEN